MWGRPPKCQNFTGSRLFTKSFAYRVYIFSVIVTCLLLLGLLVVLLYTVLVVVLCYACCRRYRACRRVRVRLVVTQERSILKKVDEARKGDRLHLGARRKVRTCCW